MFGPSEWDQSVFRPAIAFLPAQPECLDLLMLNSFDPSIPNVVDARVPDECRLIKLRSKWPQSPALLTLTNPLGHNRPSLKPPAVKRVLQIQHSNRRCDLSACPQSGNPLTGTDTSTPGSHPPAPLPALFAVVTGSAQGLPDCRAHPDPRLLPTGCTTDRRGPDGGGAAGNARDRNEGRAIATRKAPITQDAAPFWWPCTCLHQARGCVILRNAAMATCARARREGSFAAMHQTHRLPGIAKASQPTRTVLVCSNTQGCRLKQILAQRAPKPLLATAACDYADRA